MYYYYFLKCIFKIIYIYIHVFLYNIDTIHVINIVTWPCYRYYNGFCIHYGIWWSWRKLPLSRSMADVENALWRSRGAGGLRDFLLALLLALGLRLGGWREFELLLSAELRKFFTLRNKLLNVFLLSFICCWIFIRARRTSKSLQYFEVKKGTKEFCFMSLKISVWASSKEVPAWGGIQKLEGGGYWWLRKGEVGERGGEER